MFGIRIYLPWNNLGCLGLRIGSRFYTDVYTSPCWGWYVNINGHRYTLPLRTFWKGFRKWR